MMAPDELIESSSFKPHLRGWLHAIGLPLFFGSSILLFLRAHSGAQVVWILCFVLGVGSMLFTSASYHPINWSPQARRRWQRADHFAIFLAITGTYLAIIGLTVHGTIRTVVLIVFGVGTVAGILIRQLTIDTQNWVNTLPYLVMGWAAVAVMPQIYRGGGATCLWLIIAGGVAYTVGAFFLGLKRPRLWPRTFGHHELFHALTLVGAGCHFAAVYIALR
jgi:hemolysin III